ncbi:hypothetical protein BKA61DRAFT_270963 [Leptodontidium sp. MPI-SDFR-AT-0119]|nr:hypothetical protein BKA61DRAFT_270963 [Leptodontidium sp. MPI-SDFR-AT-0119]
MDTRALELLRTMVNSLSVGVELFPAPAVVVVMVMDDLQGLVAIISTVASSLLLAGFFFLSNAAKLCQLLVLGEAGALVELDTKLVSNKYRQIRWRGKIKQQLIISNVAIGK